MIIDTHCHLSDKAYQDNISEVIKRAKNMGVVQMIVIGTNSKDNKMAVEIAEKYNLYAAVGVHPSDADTEKVEDIIKYLNHPRVVAIGECGIDLYWRQDNLEKQIEVFKDQIELAIKYDLPLVIHNRESIDEIIKVLKPYKGKVRGVFHCFTYGKKQAEAILDLGFHLGLGGVLTFKNAKELQETAKDLPLDKLILETDSPYLTPTPHRGKTNEPGYTKYVCEKLADLRNEEFGTIADATTKNAIKLFKLGEVGNE